MKTSALCTLILLAAAAPARAARLPRIGGWKPLAKPASYDSKTLFQAINGGAEVFLAYGFRRLVQGEYRRSKREITVQLYDMGARVNAFGVFRQQRPPGSKPVALPAAAEAVFSAPHQCLAHKGGTFVKAYATAGKLSSADCRLLLKALLRGVSGATAPLAELALLPARGRVAGSVKYAPRSYLGLRDLGGALHASYTGQGRKLRLFVLLPAGRKRIAARWRRLGKRWKKVAGEPSILQRTIPYSGVVVLRRTSKGIFGAAGAGSLAAALKVLKPLL